MITTPCSPSSRKPSVASISVSFWSTVPRGPDALVARAYDYFSSAGWKKAGKPAANCLDASGSPGRYTVDGICLNPPKAQYSALVGWRPLP